VGQFVEFRQFGGIGVDLGHRRGVFQVRRGAGEAKYRATSGGAVRLARWRVRRLSAPV
jgi:hypothetical protein